MPSNRHLEFAEVEDFTPGYFSVGDWLMPANGSQEMKDCRPDPGGGLRAAVKPVTFSTTGIPSTAKCVGIYVRGGVAGQTGSGLAEANDRYLAVYDTADNKVKIYRWNETLASAPTTWTLVKAHAAVVATPNPVLFDTFVDSTGAAHVLWTLAHTSSDDGLWSLQFSYQAGSGVSAIDDLGATATRTATNRLAGFTTGLAVQDDIAIVAQGTHFSTLRWSASQDITSFPAPNNLILQASRQGAVVTCITPFAPSDLLVGMKYASWTLIQGDITDPVVRTQSNSRYPQFVQRASFTSQGVAFVSASMGVYLTSTGESFEPLSDQISPDLWAQATANGDTGVGETAYSGDFLLAPHGLFYDERTHGWHRSSVLIPTTADHFHSWADLQNHKFFVATGGSSFALWQFDATEHAQRWNTYTWKGAPLHRPDGRQVEVREVQVYAKAYDASATVAVTVNGTTKTVTFAASGRQQLNFLFSERAEVLDVQIVASAASSGVEAPSVEVLRIGTQSRHTLR